MTEDESDDSLKYKYLSVNRDVQIDLERLKRGEYTKEELNDVPINLGKYKEYDIFVKHGQYGAYLEWNQIKISLKNAEIAENDISLQSAILLLDQKESPDSLGTFIVRTISPTCTIRRGKYGPYIHYYPTNSKKPEFYSIKKFKEDFTKCDISHLVEWVNKKHKVSLNIL